MQQPASFNCSASSLLIGRVPPLQRTCPRRASSKVTRSRDGRKPSVTSFHPLGPNAYPPSHHSLRSVLTRHRHCEIYCMLYYAMIYTTNRCTTHITMHCIRLPAVNCAILAYAKQEVRVAVLILCLPPPTPPASPRQGGGVTAATTAEEGVFRGTAPRGGTVVW
jgi:hypothetical protein